MSGSGREAPPGYPRVIRMPSQICGSCLAPLRDAQEWSGDSAECSRVVRRPSWMSGSCRETRSEVWEALPDVR